MNNNRISPSENTFRSKILFGIVSTAASAAAVQWHGKIFSALFLPAYMVTPTAGATAIFITTAFIIDAIFKRLGAGLFLRTTLTVTLESGIYALCATLHKIVPIKVIIIPLTVSPIAIGAALVTFVIYQLWTKKFSNYEQAFNLEKEKTKRQDLEIIDLKKKLEECDEDLLKVKKQLKLRDSTIEVLDIQKKQSDSKYLKEIEELICDKRKLANEYMNLQFRCKDIMKNKSESNNPINKEYNNLNIKFTLLMDKYEDLEEELIEAVKDNEHLRQSLEKHLKRKKSLEKNNLDSHLIPPGNTIKESHSNSISPRTSPTNNSPRPNPSPRIKIEDEKKEITKTYSERDVKKFYSEQQENMPKNVYLNILANKETTTNTTENNYSKPLSPTFKLDESVALNNFLNLKTKKSNTNPLDTNQLNIIHTTNNTNTNNTNNNNNNDNNNKSSESSSDD